MARRSKAHDYENHERWLIAYADFITLLFAFFVVMFASSQADKGRAQQVSESVRASIAGYADTAPVASNETEEGRARNRRADIILLNEQGLLAEPSKEGEAGKR
jgi:chemotaxis protein MotB